MDTIMKNNVCDFRLENNQSPINAGTAHLPLNDEKETRVGSNIGQEAELYTHSIFPRHINFRTWLIAFLGAFIILAWLLADCLPSVGLDKDYLPDTRRLVKNAVATPIATPSVLEDFQVYQPVLTPSVATGAIIVSTGEDNSTTVASLSGSVCEVLLMDYSFGYSYGMPFIGKNCSSRAIIIANSCRNLYATQLQIQPSQHELHSDFKRKAV